MMRTLLAGTVAILWFTGCRATPQPLDVMTMPPVCSLPTPVLTTPLARLPDTLTPDPALGALVGYVADSAGHALPSAVVQLDPPRDSDGRVPGQLMVADSLGAFAVRGISPGRHRLEVRAPLYVRRRWSITVRSGGVDTIRAHLRYYNCVGY
jgi:hypothetical protein